MRYSPTTRRCARSLLLAALLFVSMWQQRATAAGVPATVTECADCGGVECATVTKCATYECDGQCRASAAQCAGGNTNHYNCKVLQDRASTATVGYDYYGGSCTVYAQSQTFDAGFCYPNGPLGNSFYLTVLGVYYQDQLGYWALKVCESGKVCTVPTSGEPQAFTLDVFKPRPFYVSLPPRRRLRIAVAPVAGNPGALTLRGNSDAVPTESSHTSERIAAEPTLLLDYCPSRTTTPDDYYFTVTASAPAQIGFTLTLSELSCETTTTTSTTTSTVAATSPPPSNGASGTAVSTTSTTRMPTPASTPAPPTPAPCAVGTERCACRALGQRCNAPLSCVLDVTAGARRCLCAAGSPLCPCRDSAAPSRCDDANYLCANERCALAPDATLAPTPAPTLSLQQRCAAGECSACIGCALCLLGGAEQCAYCGASGLCVERVAECSDAATLVVTAGGPDNVVSACGQKPKNASVPANSGAAAPMATKGDRPPAVDEAAVASESGLGTAETIGIVISVLGLFTSCASAAAAWCWAKGKFCWAKHVRNETHLYSCQHCKGSARMYPTKAELQRHIAKEHHRQYDTISEANAAYNLDTWDSARNINETLSTPAPYVAAGQGFAKPLPRAPRQPYTSNA